MSNSNDIKLPIPKTAVRKSEEWWDLDRKKPRKISFFDRNDKRVGWYIHYYDNGNVDTKFYYNENGNYEYTSSYYYDGTPRREVKIDGEYKIEKEWFPNANLKKICNYKNGIHHGLCETYKEDGSLECRRQYDNGNFVDKNDMLRKVIWECFEERKLENLIIEYQKYQNDRKDRKDRIK